MPVPRVSEVASTASSLPDGLQWQGGLQFADGATGALAVRLVDDRSISDFEQTRFHGLNCIAEAGCRDNKNHACDFGDVKFGSTGSDGHKEYQAESRRIDRIMCGSHSDAITEGGSARDGRLLSANG